MALEATSAARKADLSAQGIHQVDVTLTSPKQGSSCSLCGSTDRGLVPGDHCGFPVAPSCSSFKNPFRIHDLTLLINDLIFANKFHYGVRLPVITPRFDDNTPQRGCHGVSLPKPSLTTLAWWVC
jgi:hypothetical protein